MTKDQSKASVDRTMFGSVALLAMRRGEDNKLDVALSRELIRGLESAVEAGARSILLTGHGNVFSLGVDLNKVVENGNEHWGVLMGAAVDLFTAVFSCPLPVVVAINGDATAGGCVLAFCADIRVMSSGSARLGGFLGSMGPYPPTALEFVRFYAGNTLTQRLLFGGVLLTAPEALAAGLIEEVVDPEGLQDRALAIATSMAAAPADSFRFLKKQLRGPVLAAAEAARERHAEELAACWRAPEVLTHLGLPAPTS
jgi:enoyl-CoA hydratase/carnithine racemase